MTFWRKIKAFVTTKHFLKHSAYILLTYIIIVGALVLYLDAYTNHGEKIELPNFVGKSASFAIAQGEELDIEIKVLDSVYRPDLPEGTVVKQAPENTKKTMVYVKSGRVITLTVSKRSELVEVPYLVDRSERFAESVLQNRGLKVKKSYQPTSEQDGAVLRQLYNGQPVREGMRIPKGATITLIVGQNDAAQPVATPNLIDLTISEAKGRLQGTSLVLQIAACEGCQNAEDSTSAVIFSQSPEFLEGTELPAGTTIMINARK